MNTKIIYGSMVTFLILVTCHSIGAAEKFSGLIIMTKGTVTVERKGKQITAKKKMFVAAADTIITKKSAVVGIQLSDGITTQIGENSRVLIKDLLKDGKTRTVNMQVVKGSLMSRVNPGDEKVQMEITSPTLVAAVRGTEFSVEADKEDESTIKVNEGEIVINSAAGDSIKDETLKAGEKIVAGPKEAIRGILDTFEKEKFRMLDSLDQQKEKQFEAYMEQVRRNEAIRENMRNQQLPSNNSEE